MSLPSQAEEVFDREFLQVRARLLELAAVLDRIDRADGSASGDVRLSKIYEALDVLKSADDGRAEQIQLIFSREYEDDWRRQFELAPR